MQTIERGYLWTNSNLNYPFLGPVVGTTTAAKQLKWLFADFSLILDHKYTTDLGWDDSVCLQTFTITSGVVNLTITNQANSLTLFTSSGATFSSTAWDDWLVCEWYDAGHLALLKLVLNNKRLTDSSDPHYVAQPYTLDQALVLGHHAVEVRTRRVTSLNVVTYEVDETGNKLSGSNPTATYSFTGAIPVQAGYNTVIAVNPDDSTIPVAPGVSPSQEIRPTNQLQFSMQAGSGQGQFPMCLDPTATQLVVRSINGVTPDTNGNVNIEITDCYRWERAVVFTGMPPSTNPRKGKIVPGEMWIYGDCEACSKCQDYADLYKLLRQLYIRAQSLQIRLLAVNSSYNDIVQNLNVVQDYVNTSQGFFRVIRNTEDVYTVHFHLKNGTAAFTAVTLELTPPAGWNLEYIPYNAWEKQPNLPPAQINEEVSATGGLGLSLSRAFPANTRSWWWWSVRLTPIVASTVSTTPGGSDTELGCPTTTASPLLSGTLSCTDGMTTSIFGPMIRLAQVAIPQS